MSLIAEVTLFSPLMDETTRAVPEMTFRMEDIQLLADGTENYLFWAEGRSFDRLDAALDDDPTVDDWTCMTDLGDRRLYRVSFTDAAQDKVTYPEASANDIVYLEMVTTADRTRVRARVPDRDGLQSYFEDCQSKGIQVNLESVYREDSCGIEPRYGLTEPQHEALLRAFEAGYFDTEREVTLADVAADLGISRQALSGRLRRGHQQLIRATLAE
jgi:predicted DNA binding protein